MIVYDPSRIHLAVNSIWAANEGYFVEEYVKANDAIAESMPASMIPTVREPAEFLRHRDSGWRAGQRRTG
ncbi:MAG: hypothetical protein ACLSA6_16510 [Holdemania massiliensis]